jgi:poly(3-hydroxybutyrate) depolymerase
MNTKITLFESALLLLLLLSCATVTAAEEETNEDDVTCRVSNGRDTLLLSRAKRTCITSTEFDGERCFFTKVPACAGPNSPLVFDIHGYSSCPVLSTYYTGWSEKSEEDCFVLVLPLGVNDKAVADKTCFGFPGGMVNPENGLVPGYPSCCCFKDFLPVETNDPAFFREVAAVVVRDTPIKTSNKVTIDSKRIYMAGHSNGCIASLGMATLHSDLVAAVGCHSGSTVSPFADNYTPTPVFMVHGKADTDVDYNGDYNLFGARTSHEILSNANECTSSSESSFEVQDNNVTVYTSSSCASNATVVLYAIDGVSHFPYPAIGLDVLLSTPGESPVLTTMDTTQLAWDFLKAHSLENAPELVVHEIPEPPPDSSTDDEIPESSAFPKGIVTSLFFTVATVVLNTFFA